MRPNYVFQHQKDFRFFAMILQGVFSRKERSQEASDIPEAVTAIPYGPIEPALTFCERDLNKIHTA